jgi:predicted lipid-binding transport protein (Tim44 family)
MASADANSSTGPTFPVAWIGGIAAGLLVALVAGLTVGADLSIPVLILTALLAIVAIAYRTIGSSRSAATDNRDNVPRLRAEGERPLGDTPEAHDEISPHDLPPDHPGRRKAEEMAEEQSDGETSGMAEGGAAGAGGSEQDAGGRSEPQGEAQQGARTD